MYTEFMLKPSAFSNYSLNQRKLITMLFPMETQDDPRLKVTAVACAERLPHCALRTQAYRALSHKKNDAEMERIFLQLILRFCIIAIFMLIPPWMLGGSLCRMSASWTEEDKVKTYFVIRVPWLAKLLIGQHFGCNSHFRTNLPILYNQFHVNPYPNRLSLLGLIDYLVTIPLCVDWIWVMSGYLCFRKFDNALIPTILLLLMLHALAATIMIGWNWDKRSEGEPLSRAELKMRKKSK